MDNLISFGTKAFKDYSEKNQTSHSDGQTSHQSQGNSPSGGYGSTGGAHLNRPAGDQMIDSDGDAVFDNAFSFLKSRSKKDNEEDIDESRATEAHDRAYNKGEGGSLDASSMGAAAALQAFKQFTSSGGDPTSKSSAGGGGQSKLIGMAMAQAAKLFDKSGGAANGGKQDAVNSAGQMIMKGSRLFPLIAAIETVI